MTDRGGSMARSHAQPSLLVTDARLAKRQAADRRFRAFGVGAIAIPTIFLACMLISILVGGIGAFTTTQMGLDITFSEEFVDPDGTRDSAKMRSINYKPLISAALEKSFPEVQGRSEKRALYQLISSGAVYELRDRVLAAPELIGTTQRIWVIASSDANLYVARKPPESENVNLEQLSTQQRDWLAKFAERGDLRQAFNWNLITKGDSREPEMAGILGALMGTFFSLLVCLAISFPLGVLTAVYLEEFSRKSRLTDIIEVNINNLAAVPSIVFGLLGLSIFLNVLHLPRSTPLVGGMTLALMTLPTIIISSRASLRAVPPSVREAALGLGASRLQATFHHTVPLALPGMLTGTIVGMAQALGETAPLLMIGMIAFIVDVPGSFVDAATSLPVQVFLWADSPEAGFRELTSAAIIVLLSFLVLMNLAAVILRSKLERRW